MSCKPELARAADYFSTDHLRAGLRTRALRGASVTLIAQASIFGAGIVGSIILARLLTPADFGLVTMVLSFGMVLQSFGSTGFIEATIQREEVEHEQISTVFWIGVALSLFLTVLFMASRDFMSSSVATFMAACFAVKNVCTNSGFDAIAGVSTAFMCWCAASTSDISGSLAQSMMDDAISGVT